MHFPAGLSAYGPDRATTIGGRQKNTPKSHLHSQLRTLPSRVSSRAVHAPRGPCRWRGEFKPRQIRNPSFDPDVGVYDGIGAVGFDLWTVDSGSIFDNILVCNTAGHATRRAKELFGPTAEGEKYAKRDWETGGRMVRPPPHKKETPPTQPTPATAHTWYDRSFSPGQQHNHPAETARSPQPSRAPPVDNEAASRCAAFSSYYKYTGSIRFVCF